MRQWAYCLEARCLQTGGRQLQLILPQVDISCMSSMTATTCCHMHACGMHGSVRSHTIIAAVTSDKCTRSSQAPEHTSALHQRAINPDASVSIKQRSLQPGWAVCWAGQ